MAEGLYVLQEPAYFIEGEDVVFGAIVWQVGVLDTAVRYRLHGAVHLFSRQNLHTDQQQLHHNWERTTRTHISSVLKADISRAHHN